MKASVPPAPVPPPLFSRRALLTFLFGAVTLLAVLLPLAQGRLHKALELAPSSLSINYLELSLSQRPSDPELRMALVKKLIQTGQLSRAREALQPLLAAKPTGLAADGGKDVLGAASDVHANTDGSAPAAPGVLRAPAAAAPATRVDAHTEAQLVLLEIDRSLWAAVPEREAVRRNAALQQVLQDVNELQIEALPIREQERCVALYRALDRPLEAAEILDRLARQRVPEPEQRVQAADAAWLAADLPARAAELQASAAALRDEHGLAHARLAIARSQASGETDAGSAMIARMRALYPDDLGLLELATRVAEGESVERAFELATELTRKAPERADYHRWVARLAEATNRSLRALDEYVWLVRHGGGELDRQRALTLAKANWDLPLVRELMQPAAAAAFTTSSTPAAAAPSSTAPRAPSAPPTAQPAPPPRAKPAAPRPAPSPSPARAIPPTPKRTVKTPGASLIPAASTRSYQQQRVARGAAAPRRVIGLPARDLIASAQSALLTRSGGLGTGPRPLRRSERHGYTCQASSSRRVAGLRDVRERVALDEALGDGKAALAKLTAAVSGVQADELELWHRKFDLELTLGDTRAALATAQQLLARFGRGARASERVAGLQLKLGDARAALVTLQAAELSPSDDRRVWLARLARLAFELADVASERAAYAELIKLPDPALWQYQRLWELAPNPDAALSIALAAFERFGSPHMLYAALTIYAERGDDRDRIALLERAEQSADVRALADYWQTRISLHQQQAAAAEKRHDYALAKRELARAEALLERAPQHAELAKTTTDRLWKGQRAQSLSLGLASDDKPLTERAYADYHPSLTARERVYVLQKLGHEDEALALALASLAGSALSESDRDVLTADARALSRGIERYVRVTGDGIQMDGLAALSSLATVEYGDRAAGIRGEVSMTQYLPRETPNSADRVLANEARDVAGALRGKLGVASLELGVRVRDERSPRPFGTLALQLAGAPGTGMVALRLHGNVPIYDTARLRALGVRDAVELETALPLGRHFYLSARGLAEAYSTREDRTYLGAGLSLDAGFGAQTDLPAKLGAAGLRIAGRLAPRFAHDFGAGTVLDGVAVTSSTSFLPISSQWAGLGASLGRGRLDTPPLIGRELAYVLDGSAGWLWPQSGLGFTARAGFGFSVFGADLFTLAAYGGNVVGSSVWGANLGYGVTIDR
ncbi:MAG: tetratricopeptide repeat protein [Polyangiales bacterium]